MLSSRLHKKTINLLFNRILVNQEQHNQANKSREKGEYCPYHITDRFLIGNLDDCLSGIISERDETGYAKQHCDKRTAYGCAEFLGHCAGRKNQSGG